MQRRQFISSAGALAGLGLVEFAPWHGIASAAKQLDDFIRGPRVKDHALTQLSDHVWSIISPDGFPTPENQGMMCNIVAINTRKGLIVVDTGASVQIGEMSLRQLRKQFSKPVVALINTHYHGDHWLGNQAYVEAFGDKLPIYAHEGTIADIKGTQGNLWRSLMEQWTNQATLGTRIVPPNKAVGHGAELDFGDVKLRIHHYGRVHTPSDLCVEVVQDRVMLVGDVAMYQRIANMDDGSYVGTLKAFDALEATSAKLWVPGHGTPGSNVLKWNRELFEGIYQGCEAAVKEGLPLEDAKPRVLRDPRVANRAKETKGFDLNIGKYVSLAYLEAETAAF